MKKIILISMFVVSLGLLTGCGVKQPDMKELTKDGYNYRNDDLGFSLMLPAEFTYYQTQRKETPDYVDIEIFVPTSDTKYPQEVPSYAKPVVIRSYDKKFWDGMKTDGEDRKIYIKAGEGNGRIYTMRFWDKIPADWQNKWNASMKENIIKSFKVQ